MAEVVTQKFSNLVDVGNEISIADIIPIVHAGKSRRTTIGGIINAAIPVLCFIYDTGAMIVDLSLVSQGGIKTIVLADPNGVDRKINPSGTYTAGYEIVIVNTGANLITFDSTGINVSVSYGEKKSFIFDGTNWF